MQILHEFFHAVALSGAAGNCRNFRPKASFLRLIHDDFALHIRSRLNLGHTNLSLNLADGAGELLSRQRSDTLLP